MNQDSFVQGRDPESSIQGKIESIDEKVIRNSIGRFMDISELTVLNLRSDDGRLRTIYSDGHSLGYSVGQDVGVTRTREDSKKNGAIVIVEQTIGYYDEQGEYVTKNEGEFQEYP